MDEGARKEFELTVSHMEDAFGWANAALGFRKTPPLFCQPPKLAITGSQLINILRRAIVEEQPLSNPLSNQPLLVSLQRVFPCLPQ